MMDDLEAVQSRARGCLLGLAVGDALGVAVEFRTAAQILEEYPDGLRDMHGASWWGLVPGQVSDDTEMALCLARSLVQCGKHDPDDVAAAYGLWLASNPPDVGNTVRGAFGSPDMESLRLSGMRHGHAEAARRSANPESQANGALMRIAPLGIFAGGLDALGRLSARDVAVEAGAAETRLSHPHPTCVAASLLLVATIAMAVAGREVSQRTPATPPRVYDDERMGWVVIALQNAFYQLGRGVGFEDALIDTVRRGGDTDTNAAICGALLGAVYGLEAIPERWARAVLDCRADRPDAYRTTDILDLADRLAGITPK